MRIASYCKCGCGTQMYTTDNRGRPVSYISGHNGRGIKRSAETCRKIGLGNLGKVLSPEAREKISKAFRGRTLTDEHKKNISLSIMGNKFNLGKKYTLERRMAARFRCYGDKHWNWKGGITTANMRVRLSLEMKLWREAVFKRDNYTCQACGARNGLGKSVRLEADHVMPFSLYPALRFEVLNGRTLCKPCHKKTDTYCGRLANVDI